MLRRSAAAVTAVIVAIVLPYILGDRLPSCPSAPRTGCCGSPRPPPSPSSRASRPYPQVTAGYTPASGYFPLAPWAGFAVLCAWAALALALAAVLLRRRDA